MSERCGREGCGEGWAVGCHHGRWCYECALRHAGSDEGCRNVMAAAVVKFMAAIEPLVRLREEVLPARVVALDTAAGLYETGREKYRWPYEDAGAPYGEADAGMWRWHLEEFELPTF